MTSLREVTFADLPVVAPQLWAWMQESPEANFDDSGPDTENGLAAVLVERLTCLERLWICETDGEMVGAIGYRPLSDDSGMLHGVCFTALVHGQGVARAALADLLAQLRAEGVRSVSAAYFADNARVRRFLQRSGFWDACYWRGAATRHGVPCDVRIVAQLLEVDPCRSADCSLSA